MDQALLRLDIYLNRYLLGHLDYVQKSGQLQFEYAPVWLGNSENFPISRVLPLREEKYAGPEVSAYFDNLLPDSVSVRQKIAAKFRAPSDSVFHLLAAIGGDCVGALQFLPAGSSAPKMRDAEGSVLSDLQVASRLRNLSTEPLALSADGDFRLSLAGAQEKTALLFDKGRWFLPLGTTASTHILKPEKGELSTVFGFSDSVENEWLCAQIVRAFNLPICECEIVQFLDVKTLVVKRFDRAWHERKVIRIPQEDLCQAHGISSHNKYESDGGPGVVRIMQTLLESNRPMEDRCTFIKAQVVFFLLGAIDGHAKNFSLRWGPGGFSLAPLYDIISVQPLIKSKKIQSEKVKMAMALGDSRYYKLREILRRHFLQTAKKSRFAESDADAIIEQTVSEVGAVIDQVSGDLPKKFPADVAESIFKGIRERVKRLG